MYFRQSVNASVTRSSGPAAPSRSVPFTRARRASPRLITSPPHTAGIGTCPAASRRQLEREPGRLDDLDERRAPRQHREAQLAAAVGRGEDDEIRAAREVGDRADPVRELLRDAGRAGLGLRRKLPGVVDERLHRGVP